MKPFIDLVICGPDMSGTSTQIEDTIEFFQKQNKIVRDMRGTEDSALFHAERFNLHNKNELSLDSFINKNNSVNSPVKLNLVYEISHLRNGFYGEQKLRIASMIKNDVTTYINLNSADVWIFEEPTHRGAGQDCRIVENNRSKFDSKTDQIAIAMAHQSYRIAEFLKFRKPLREAGKIIIRSRSEESGCYQIFEKDLIKSGIIKTKYLNLPGHKIAFANPPTHLFIVCGPKDWTVKEYVKLKKERSKDRVIDDLENNAPYQVLVNKRYATDWLENLYQEGCNFHGGTIPKITSGIRYLITTKAVPLKFI